MEQVCFTLPTMEQVEFCIQISQDDNTVRGNASAVDPETDKATEDAILARLEAGDEWAWAIVTIVAKFRGRYGYDSLSGCSYANEEDFIASDYYTEMKSIAYDELLANLKKLSD